MPGTQSTRQARLARCLLPCLAFSMPLAVTGAEDSGFHSTAAHTHGHATLTVILSGQLLVLGFESPAFNLLGFESAPQTPEQEAALARAEVLLASADTLLQIADARCEVTDLQITRPGQEAHAEQGHDHDEDGHAHAAGAHWEYRVNVNMQCAALPAPLALSTPLFELFTGLETVDLLWATDTRQGAATLTAASPATILN